MVFGGMLTGSFFGLCANTYEREKLAWIYATPISGDIINAPLSDYVTAGSAYKYHPPSGGAYEYYYFENHQKLNIYDDATANPSDKGIFVLHQGDFYNSQSDIIRVKTSNGQWNWSNPSTVPSCPFYGAPLPNFIMSSVNRAGSDNRDRVTDAQGNLDWIYVFDDVCGDYSNGQYVNNSFNLNYNNVFSPYSNPNTNTWNNTQNNFTMEITGTNGNIVNARFYLTNPLDGKPSKPQNLRITNTQYTSNFSIHLAWDANLEPDIVLYEVWRNDFGMTHNGWWLIATTTSTTYSDPDYAWASTFGNARLQYKIRAKDTQNNFSVYSDIASTTGEPNFRVPQGEQQATEQVAEEVPTETGLYQNYPNPFNPSTNIRFTIREAGFTTLKVYDVLGREVATLLSEVKNPGTYSIQFNGSNMTSGIYFVRLTVPGKVLTQRIVLMK